ncbi:MAG: energy transducer TonB, partial [Rhizomicrobium sp.]
WKLNDSYSLPAPVKNPVDVCGPAFADAQKSWSTYKSTTFKFRLSSGGAVEMPFVAVSSGSAAFDAKAFQCLTSIVYSPPMVNGVAFDASWGAAVRWSPHTGLAYTNAQGVGPACSDDDFPPNLWKGDPPRPTTISFHIRAGGTIGGAAIEQSSGNPQLDQAALSCVEHWPSEHSNASSNNTDIGELVRFTWKGGYAFTSADMGD